MKFCNKCKETRLISEFSINKSKKDGLASYCKECCKKIQQNYYKQNTSYYKLKSLSKKKKISDYLKKIKEENPCMDCNKSYPYYVMDFDHKFDKKFLVSKMSNLGSFSLIKEEIKKCDIICSNCHRIRTYNRLKDKSDSLKINE